MLLPYYIASMNIEHEYYELTSSYQAFEGICLVDTFELAEGKQLPLFTEQNTARVERQKRAPIFVIIGNPPYNAGQVNENDNNKNRKYPAIDNRVFQTYGKASQATLQRKLNDPYIKAIRWASDRIGKEGIVAFVSNSSFISDLTFDGMREHLEQDFNRAYILDLKGNVRKDSMREGIPIGEQHTVFGLAAMVGVAVSFFVKNSAHKDHRIYYSSVDWRATRHEKFALLESAASVNGIEWKEVIPNTRHDWLTEGMSEAFESFLPLGTKAAKSSRAEAKAIFKIFSLGVGTNRDPWVYSFDLLALKERVATFVEVYQATLDRVKRRHPKSAEDVIDTTDHRIQWTRQIKAALLRHEETAVNPDHFRIAVYRPFTKLHLYFDEFWNEERYQQHLLFPTTSAESENRALCVGGYGRKQFAVLMCNLIPNLNFYADPAQCFSFYTYAADGTNRRENITDWALEQFRTQYNDNRISKWDLFHYVYAILQHPLYRERYAANLRRELPRIPFVPAFWEFVEAGAGLAELHVNYEKQAEYPLQVLESKDVPLNWQVEKMRLSKDKAQITYNNFLTLAGIPLEVFEYRLGNRSALEWIIDQYQIKTDKRSAILNDPNRHDDPEYIVRLVGKIVTVSLKTIRIVKDLPSIE